jgi:CheY-like chemotaxis protein
VERALDLAAPAATEKGLDLAYVIDDSAPPTLVGDPIRLRQILVHLVGTAVTSTGSGAVVVAATAQHREGRIYALDLAVRGTGGGKVPEQCERVFQPFGAAGSGLGLMINRRLAALMGGTITVVSDGDDGAVFRVTVVVEAVVDPAHLRPRRLERELAGKQLLLTDDNETVRRLLAVQLTAWGVDVVGAASGREALLLLEQRTGFDAAILDVSMPEPGGLALARQIRRTRGYETLPLVIMGPGGPLDVAHAPLARIQFVSKPVKCHELRRALLKALAAPADAVRGCTVRDARGGVS